MKNAGEGPKKDFGRESEVKQGGLVETRTNDVKCVASNKDNSSCTTTIKFS
jgi:hypothetical protein